MTTIALKDGVLAVDSGEWQDSLYLGEADKIIRVRQGVWLAACGSACYGSALAECIRDKTLRVGMRLDMPYEAQFDASAAIVTTPDGAFHIYGRGLVYEIKYPMALGSGGMIANVAMRNGCSAVQAVRLACKLDAFTRGPVRWKKVGT